MKQKKQFFLLIGVTYASLFFAQVGVNTSTPRSTLDITAKTTDGSAPEGLLIPRLTGDQIKAADLNYGFSNRGTLVYATSAVTTASTKTGAVSGSGFYYFDGTIWQKLLPAGSSASPFVPYVVASGKATNSYTLNDAQGYTPTTFTGVTTNDGNWSASNNIYTVAPGKAGLYLISLQGIQSPSANHNSFSWRINIVGQYKVDVHQIGDIAANRVYNSGGSIVLSLKAGDVVSLGFQPCNGCGSTSYTVTTRAFSITYLGS